MTAIREFVIRHNLSNREMAGLTGVTMRTIVNWTCGHKDTPLSVLVLAMAVDRKIITLDQWRKWAVQWDKSPSSN